MLMEGATKVLQSAAWLQRFCCNMEAAVVTVWLPQLKVSPTQLKLAEDIVATKWPKVGLGCEQDARNARHELACSATRKHGIRYLEVDDTSLSIKSFVGFHRG
jgi:hypothetical protein